MPNNHKLGRFFGFVLQFLYFCTNNICMMSQEIERKFIVRGDFRAEVFQATHVIQGYLSHGPSVRVRIRGNSGYLTIKGPVSKSGMSRFEWEKEITVDEALALLELAETSGRWTSFTATMKASSWPKSNWAMKTSLSTSPIGLARKSLATRAITIPC